MDGARPRDDPDYQYGRTQRRGQRGLPRRSYRRAAAIARDPNIQRHGHNNPRDLARPPWPPGGHERGRSGEAAGGSDGETQTTSDVHVGDVDVRWTRDVTD